MGTTRHDGSARYRRAGAAVAVGAALLVPASAWASPAGAPAPTIEAAALPGSVVTIPQCDGEVIVQRSGGLLKVERPNATSGEIAVDVTYSGSLQPGTDYDPLPDPVIIANGESATFLTVSAEAPGTVTLTIEAGAGYTVGDPASATSEISDSGGRFGCQDEVVEVIGVGTQPKALPIYDTYGFGVGDSTLVMTGDVPPGLTYGSDGSWSGAATTVGAYEFTACYQLGDFCGLEIPFRITVVTADVPIVEDPPLEPAPAARPVPGTPSFTG